MGINHYLISKHCHVKYIFFLFLLACGGTVQNQERDSDVEDSNKADSKQDSALFLDAPTCTLVCDYSVGWYDSCKGVQGFGPGCEANCGCTNKGFSCNGILQDDAMSCLKCNLNCDSGDK